MAISTKMEAPAGAPRRKRLAEVLEFDTAGGFVVEAGEEAVVVVAVGAPDGEDEDGHEVEAGEAGGPGGAGDAEGGDADAVGVEGPVMAED